jgi:hypothetical protein
MCLRMSWSDTGTSLVGSLSGYRPLVDEGLVNDSDVWVPRIEILLYSASTLTCVKGAA